MSKNLPPNPASFFPNIFVKNQFGTKTSWPAADTNLTGKVALITGANQGLGLETSEQLLSLKLSELIIAVRTVAKGEAAARTLRSRYPDATIRVLQVDMTSYESIQAFVTQAEQLERLDIVILNAGIRNLKFEVVPATNHEAMLQVNYISTVLLCILLLPTLKRKSVGGPGRMTIVSSGLALAAKFENRDAVPLLPSFHNPTDFNSSERYDVSKLLGLMFVYKIPDFVSADDVVVNIVDPGFVKGTNLTTGLPFPLSILFATLKFVAARPINVGASTYVDAAVLKGSDSHGSYIMSWQISPFPPFMYTADGKKIIDKLWQETMSELKFANVQQILDGLAKA